MASPRNSSDGWFPLLRNFVRANARKFYVREWDRGNVWKATRKRKCWARLNFYAYAWPSIQCLYFIYARKIYVYARKNYATLETHLKKRAQKFHTDDLSLQTPKTESLIKRYLVLCAFKSVKHFFTRVM